MHSTSCTNLPLIKPTTTRACKPYAVQSLPQRPVLSVTGPRRMLASCGSLTTSRAAAEGEVRSGMCRRLENYR